MNREGVAVSDSVSGGVLHTVEEIANKFRLHPETVRRAYRNGNLRVQPVGRHIRIPEDAAAEWRKAGCPTMPKKKRSGS